MSEKQLLRPPRFVQNEQGKIIDVIVSYDDYRQFLRTLAAHADWETLPTCLQNAIDHLLAEGKPRLNQDRHSRSVQW